MKLLKPIEYYMTSRKLSKPNLLHACTRDLCVAVGMGLGDDPNQSGVNVSASQGGAQELGCSLLTSREDFPAKLSEKIAYLREHKKKKLLAKLFWMVALARVSMLQQQIETETSILSRQLGEICECLEGIKTWLCNNDKHNQEPHRWLQKTIRSQGALLLLQDLLEWMSNCGFPINGGWCPSNKINTKLGNANMRAMRASLMFLKVCNGIYDILRLSCTGFPKTALVFRWQMGLFDLHLGTELRAALLMRQMLMNPSILTSLSPADIHRYVRLTAGHKTPAFVGLLRSLVRIDSQPLPGNQQRITHLLLDTHRGALPCVRIEHTFDSAEDTQEQGVVPGEGAREGDGLANATHRIFIKRHAGSENRFEGDDEWLDMHVYRGRVLEITQKDSLGDGRSMALSYYAECLLLFDDLCSGRNRQGVAKLAANPALCLSYKQILSCMRSDLIPNEIRCRLARLMISMYLDREPQQARLPIEYEYVWSKVVEKPLTARPLLDPFADMPALDVTPNFVDLKEHGAHARVCAHRVTKLLCLCACTPAQYCFSDTRQCLHC